MGGGRWWEKGTQQQTERMSRRERRMPRWAGGGLWRKRRMPQWMKGVTRQTKGIAQREGKMPRRKRGDAIEKGRDAAAGERCVTAGKKRAAVGESNAFPNVLFHFLEKKGIGRDTFPLFYLPLRANTRHSVLRKCWRG